MREAAGKTTKHAASVAFDAASLLMPDDLPGFLSDVMKDGDTLALPLALRTAADVLGMTELARRTGLSRESLYRTLSSRDNPRLDTLAAILSAFDLRLTVAPVSTKPRRASQRVHACA
jgi:probable addiction module antidote protein